MNWEDHFVLDDSTTWPRVLVECVRANEGTVRSYLEEELRVDRLAEEDVRLRSYRPLNRYASRYEDIKELITASVEECRFVGFHCSRLTTDEQASVQTEGIRPLSRSLAEERIRQLLAKKAIRPATAQSLLSRNQVSDPCREGHACFFHCVSSLRDEHGLYRLFRCWGGEAIYNLHEDNAAIRSELSGIGVPCIVVSSLLFRDLDPLGGLAERILKSYLFLHSRFGHCQDFTSNVRHPASVLRIIREHDGAFETLTGYSTWERR